MKYFKTLSLVGAMIAALMAVAGVGSASATILCSVEPGPGNPATQGTECPTKFSYNAGTEIHGVLEPGTYKTTTSFKNIECNKSTIKGRTSNEGSATETVSVVEVTLTAEECNCEVKILKAGTLEIHWIPDTFNGTVTSSGIEETVTCSSIFGNVHCIYDTSATDLGTLTGGNPATLDIESANIPDTPTNGLCSETSKWDAKYEITSPKPLYVAAHT